jgi:hypothetical protein
MASKNSAPTSRAPIFLIQFLLTLLLQSPKNIHKRLIDTFRFDDGMEVSILNRLMEDIGLGTLESSQHRSGTKLTVIFARRLAAPLGTNCRTSPPNPTALRVQCSGSSTRLGISGWRRRASRAASKATASRT